MIFFSFLSGQPLTVINTLFTLFFLLLVDCQLKKITFCGFPYLERLLVDDLDGVHDAVLLALCQADLRERTPEQKNRSIDQLINQSITKSTIR